jgi:hypothetical protein
MYPLMNPKKSTYFNDCRLLGCALLGVCLSSYHLMPCRLERRGMHSSMRYVYYEGSRNERRIAGTRNSGRVGGGGAARELPGKYIYMPGIKEPPSRRS